MRRFRIFLDANVIVDAQLRDIFLTAAELEVIDVRWSDNVLDEASHALQEKLKLTAAEVRGLRSAMTAAFPLASVGRANELHESIELPDPGDVHVLLAAIESECDLLVTRNLRDFPEESLPQGAEIGVASPDEALVEVVGLDQAGMTQVLMRTVDRLRRPEVSLEGYLERLDRTAPVGAAALGAAAGIESYQKIFHDIVRSHSETSPFEAVRLIIDGLRLGDQNRVFRLVAPELRQVLTGMDEPTATRVFAQLLDQLSDALEGDDWGFPTASRPTGPNAELVKYVKVGNEPITVREPTLLEYGHLFWMELRGNEWLLVDLDGEDPGFADYLASRPY